MVIIVKDEKEHQLILSLCDLALKAGGIQNYQNIGVILASIKQEDKKDEKS
jgi:hypothetical protein